MSDHIVMDAMNGFTRPSYIETSGRDLFASKRAPYTLTRGCPVCGKAELGTPVSYYKYFQFFTDSGELPKRCDVVDVVCDSCLALYKNPCFSEEGLKVLLAEAGRSYGASEGRESEQVEWLQSSGLLLGCDVFLDIGCYDGQFLSLLPESINRIGVDLDMPAIQRGYARDRSIQLIHSSFECFRLPARADVITLFHVLEHLTDPNAVLRRIHQESSAHAKLVVEVPILERGCTNDVNGFFSVAHLTHFSRRSLHSILSTSGWKVEERTDVPDYNGYRVIAVKSRPKPHSSLPHNGDRAYLQENLRSIEFSRAKVREKLEVIRDDDKVIIWGAGLHTEILFHTTQLFKSGGREFLLIDSDLMKQGKTWRGIPILAPDSALPVVGNTDWLVVSSYQGQSAITNAARKLGFSDRKVIRLYDFVDVR